MSLPNTTGDVNFVALAASELTCSATLCAVAATCLIWAVSLMTMTVRAIASSKKSARKLDKMITNICIASMYAPFYL